MVPTACQRPQGLARTLASINRQTQNAAIELLVVADTHGLDRNQLNRVRDDIEQIGHIRWLEHDGGLNCYGQPQRSYGSRQALGEWVAYSQDDNILAKGALSSIWLQICGQPRKRPLFFRIRTYWQKEVWQAPQLYQGNIDADCLVLPRELAQEVTWGLRYEGDFDAAVEAMQRTNGDVGWCEDLVAISRPQEADIWWS